MDRGRKSAKRNKEREVESWDKVERGEKRRRQGGRKERMRIKRRKRKSWRMGEGHRGQ